MFQPKADDRRRGVLQRKAGSRRQADRRRISLSSSAGQQGVWLNVLEKVFGELKIATSKKVHRDNIGLDAIGKGGDADDTISLLTGCKQNIWRLPWQG